MPSSYCSGASQAFYIRKGNGMTGSGASSEWTVDHSCDFYIKFDHGWSSTQ